MIRRVGRALLLTAACFLAWLCFVWPPPSWWRTHQPAQTAFMAMRERQLRATGDRTPLRYRPVSADSMSPWLGKAALAGEDQAFYLHHGIDYHAVREALGYRYATFAWGSARDRGELVRVLGKAWSRRDQLRGASTITQQLAKNLYLSPSRNPLRKVKEAVIATRLEWALGKDRILELYLNVAEFGPNLWGVEAASQRYFARPASRLSLEQAALLAATLPHPLTSNPGFRPGRTVAREQLIAQRLLGAQVEIPPAGSEDTLPPLPPVSITLPESLPIPAAPSAESLRAPAAPRADTTPRPGRDSAAAPLPKDTAAVPKKAAPKPGGAGRSGQSISLSGITRQT